ncbi:hypothetical protein, partial [Rhizobium leguminosarum]|uniref:hypothetical protein n=1 Tax=Rhizobium leguminosarum TaxID=384 RepID=UPI001C978388
MGTERTHHHANLFTCENVEITFSNVRKPRVSGSNLLKATDLKRNSVSPRISDATSLTKFFGQAVTRNPQSEHADVLGLGLPGLA